MTQQVINIARDWIGTPYLHQASKQGVGCDCLGLIRGIWRELHGHEPRAIPAYSRDWDERDRTEVLWNAASAYLIQKTENGAAEVGDVVLFRMRRGCVAKHLGVQSTVGAEPMFIHAFSGHAVTESPLSRPWSTRIVARFTFPLKG